MKTNDLIRILSEDCPSPISRHVTWPIAAIAGISAALALMIVIMGIRQDIIEVADTWRFIFKLVLSVSLAAITFKMVQRLSRPEFFKVDYRIILLPACLAFAALTSELVAVPRSSWLARMLGINALWCVVLIPSLSIAPFLIILQKLRADATTRPVMAGAFAGALAGSIGSSVYALHCVDDSPFFVMVWYSLGITIMTFIGSIIGKRFLRW